MDDTTLKQMFTQAIINFPYPDVQPRALMAGTFEPDDEGVVDYYEQYTFNAGTLCHEHIEGGAWFILHVAQNVIDIAVSARFARNGDWQNGQLLRDDERLRGRYDLNTRQWTLQIAPR